MKMLKIIASMLCICLLMVLCASCSQKTAPEPDPVAADWEECHLYHGLDSKERVLDVSSQNELGELIFNCSLTETANVPIPAEEILYGGPYVLATFVKDGVSYSWSFNSNRITKTVTEGNTTTRTYFEPNRTMLTKLDNFC